MNYTIWQPEIKNNDCFPWAVHIEGWLESGIVITIHHESLTRGQISFSNCKFRSAKEFSEFVMKMLITYRDSFKKPIRANGNDCLALMEGYRKGLDSAKQIFIR